MNRTYKLILLITLSIFLLTGCFNSIDYKELLNNQLDEIYSLEKTKQLFAIRLETELNQQFNSDHKYLNAWLEFLPDDLIKIDSAVTIYEDQDQIRIFGEFAFMDDLQAKTYEILETYGLDFDFYIRRDDGIYFRSWAFKQMHQYFEIDEDIDYTDDFVKIYDSKTANELLDTYKNHKSLRDNITSWQDILLNEESEVEDESAEYTYSLDIEVVKENLDLNNSNLSTHISDFLDITNWEAKYVLIKERLDNTTFMLTLNDSDKIENSLFSSLKFDMSRYVYSYDEPIDPR